MHDIGACSFYNILSVSWLGNTGTQYSNLINNHKNYYKLIAGGIL